ncbi:MAG: tetratricopeptide repeat protein [Geminicoccaceae bacterium]
MAPDQQGLLQALAFLYLRHGQNRRALTLILLAARNAPDDVGVLRMLAYAFVANDAPEEALDVIERLEKLDVAGGADGMRRLLTARALLHAGRGVEARAVFRQFVEIRKTMAEADTGIEVNDPGAEDRGVEGRVAVSGAATALARRVGTK